MIKFKGELEGYGFDVAADRVVRFNKHPDGTYLNTRATYTILTKQYTHFYLRSIALQQGEEVADTPKPKKSKIWWVLFAVVALLFLKDCNMETSVNVTTQSEQ